MAIKVTPTDANGNEAVPAFDWSQKFPFPKVDTTVMYQIFGRLGNNSSGQHSAAVFLCANIVSIGTSEHGLFVIQANSRMNAFAVSGVRLAPSSSSKPLEWGYYRGSDEYWYIGVKRPTYSPTMTVYLLGAGVSGGVKPASVGEYGESATAPNGWTTFTIS